MDEWVDNNTPKLLKTFQKHRNSVRYYHPLGVIIALCPCVNNIQDVHNTQWVIMTCFGMNLTPWADSIATKSPVTGYICVLKMCGIRVKRENVYIAFASSV